MRRVLAGAALAFVSALAPLGARGAGSETVTTAYTVPAGLTFPRFEKPTARPRSFSVRAIVYTLQAIDAVQTAAALRRPGRYEQNGMVRPFAHGGFATLALGFALGDIGRDRVMRRAPEQLREGANGAQALANLDGILNTRRAMHAP